MKYIKDLPDYIQELVKKNQIKQGNNGTFIGDLQLGKSSDNFNWDLTQEGYNFWHNILLSKTNEEISNICKEHKIPIPEQSNNIEYAIY